MFSIRSAKSGLTAGVLLLSAFALTGCMVPKSDLEDAQAQNAQLQTQNQQLQTQNQQLTTQLADEHAQTCRLIGAIKYTVNSDLLFPSGSYKMSNAGQTILGAWPRNGGVPGMSGGGRYTDNQAVGASSQPGHHSNGPCPETNDAVIETLAPRASSGTWCRRGLCDTNPVASAARAGPRTEPARQIPRRFGLSAT
jgi:chemotaxis protein MotB